MRSTFETYHPIINFGYFCAVIILGMFLLHPVLLGIAIIASFSYSVLLNGRGAMKFNLLFLLPMMVVIAIVNPLFNHLGETVLWYFLDEPITMESFLYGTVTACMFGTIILWFSCYNAIMTSDKFIYLFGRIMPSISLVFSMALRFVPAFRERIKVISRAQKCIGQDVTNGRLADKVRHGLKILSIMITWALENGIDTADSMRARGFGLKGRTVFSIYRFDARDTVVALLMVVFLAVVITGAALGVCRAEFFPSIEFHPLDPITAAVYGAYALLCFLPILLDIKEKIQWKLSQSKI